MALLNVDKLTVRFGGLTAVENVDFHVDEKQIFSIIGPNGAGKTTVFNVITGIYEPTSGAITFRGQRLERPLGPRLFALVAVVGLATAIVAALLSVDVGALWKATIKRNFAGPGEPFSYAAAWHSAIDYIRGVPALDRMRKGRWAVTTADGRLALGYGNSREEAETIRAKFERLMDVAGTVKEEDAVVERGGRWMICTSSGEELTTFDDEAGARAAFARYAGLNQQARERQVRAMVVFVCGLVVGAAGTWAVWSRARRTPEVIARAGIARTFQNIRLFSNMMAVDNVLVGMDRRLHGGVLRMSLQTPGIRRQERTASEQAGELLRFVGLAGRESMVARNLAYGDQRRLEIARALATQPKLVLFDEPAAGMNPSEAGELNGLIERIRQQGLSVLLIEHHMKVVMGISDRIAVLEYGRKIAEGTPEAVRNDPRVIAAYLGSEEVG